MNIRRHAALAAAAALAAFSAGASAASPPAARTTPAPPFAGYPVKVTCPTGVVMDVPAHYLPAGWASTGLGMVLKGLKLGVFQGQQLLQCDYRYQFGSEATLTTLSRPVPLGACILGPDHAWFLCRQGALP
jgi:Spy/CpxP family protein refolding chaperone